MDHQIKMMVVDAITNVVKSSPTRQNNYVYNNYIVVTKENFEIWMRYVSSVLQITAQHINMNLMISLNNQIQNIVMQSVDYTAKTNMICDILLNFAKSIMYL